MRNLAEEINRLKKETETIILAHTYQPPEIIEVADITGDSFALAKRAADIDERRIIMCGVRFMAESVKLLSPGKTVILPAPGATCAMAQQISPERVIEYRRTHPAAVVVAYINTTAALKAVCDVCVTSSSALKIVSKIDAPEILFIPDKNLGAYIKSMLRDKNIVLWDGFCPVHNALTEADVLAAKREHPGALLAMHPECPQETLAHADIIGSTAAIIDFAKKSEKPVIIGTERGVVDTLARAFPKKDFYYLCPEKLVCPDMKKISPELLVDVLSGRAGEEITVPEEIAGDAKRCIDKMLELG